MAQVFLSYDREDGAKVRSIALALEKAGHSVWWDLHVRGGTQFSKVIDEALKAADAVVVLWSAQSVESPWVRDEAATGRDRGRLVPILLDKTEAPLGFRQFQAIDLSNWKGRGAVPRLAEILHSIAGAVGEQSEQPRLTPTRIELPALPDMSRAIRLGLLTALVFAAIALAYFLVNRDKRAEVHTVAVTATDASVQPLAKDLLIKLGSLRLVQTRSVQLLREADGASADLIFEASATDNGNSGANLVLMSGKDRAVLWSKEFAQESSTPADLKLQVAYTAGRVLGCALEGLEPGGKSLPAQTLKLYLSGCSQFAEASNEAKPSVVPIFEEVVKKAPHFGAAWAKLLLAESHAVQVTEDATRLRENLRRHIAQARKVDRQMAEATIAELTLLPSISFGEALRLLDQVKERNPENTAVLRERSVELGNVGRMSDAVEDAREAARLDPTSPDALSNYVLALAHSGRIEAARLEMRRAERQWAGTAWLEDLRYVFNLRYGDPKDMLTTEAFKEANPRMQLYFRTRADPTPANVDRFIANLQQLYRRRGLTTDDIAGHAQAYGEFDRENLLYDLIGRLPANADLSRLAGVVFRPSLREFRHDPRFMIVAKRIGLVDYWTKSGKWPDFCFEPDQPYDCKAEAAKLR